MKKNLVFPHPNNKAHNWLLYEQSYALLLKLQKFIKGHVYDLGCGEMPYREWVLSYADAYTGIDWSGTLHELKADIVADLNEPLPIDSEVADTVLTFSVMEHLRKPQHFLDESYRILKRKGAIILQVPFMWWIHEAPYDYFRYTPYGLTYLLEESGYTDIQILPQGGFFTMMVLKTNYFSLRLLRGPRFLRWLLRTFFGVFWYTGQKLAPYLDKLDRHWALETGGYIVTAKKP